MLPKHLKQDSSLKLSSLSERITYLVEKEGLHEAEFARRIGMPQQVCNQILRGQTANPRLETLKKLASFFDVSVGQLVGSESFENPRHSTSSSIPLLEWNDVVSWVEAEKLPENTQWLSCDLEAGRRIYAIRSNPSLEPYYDRSSVLLIDPLSDYFPGHFVVARVRFQSITVRRLVEEAGEFFLNSVVPGIPSLLLDGENVQLLGTVVETRKSQTEPHISIRRNKMMNPMKQDCSLDRAPLGKNSTHITTYTPSLLFPIPRKIKRDEIGVSDQLPFSGVDIWTSYELSWLNSKGKPCVAMGEFWIPCESPNIIESKSLKLYFNSLNGSRFESMEQVQAIMQEDLSKNVGAPVQVKLLKLSEASREFSSFLGQCLDDLDVSCSTYQPDSSTLSTEDLVVEEALYSDLLKSNCLVTGQPDWASLQIEYSGKKINHEGLLKYIVSLRDHNEFHEQCVERIYMDIMKLCQPHALTVYARYTRRGGIDINPYRTSRKSTDKMSNSRLIRQ